MYRVRETEAERLRRRQTDRQAVERVVLKIISINRKHASDQFTLIDSETHKDDRYILQVFFLTKYGSDLFDQLEDRLCLRKIYFDQIHSN